MAQGLGGVHQGREHLIVGHRRELNGGILPAGPLMADRAGGDDQVIALDLQLDPATGAGAYKGIPADGAELLQGDHRRRSPDARGADADLLPQQGAGIDVKLPVVGHMDGVVKIAGDDLTPAWVARQNAVPAHVPGGTLDMKLYGTLFLFHGVSSSLSCRWA